MRGGCESLVGRGLCRGVDQSGHAEACEIGGDRIGVTQDGIGGCPELAHATGCDAIGQGVTATQNHACRGVHGFSTASITARASGPATAPPYASLPAFPPSSTTTATAT